VCHLPICLQDHEISALKSFQASDAGAEGRFEAGLAAQKILLQNVRICLKSLHHELSFRFFQDYAPMILQRAMFCWLNLP